MKSTHDMRYRSTSREAPLTSLRGAVLRGLAPDGGLYMPVEIARRSPDGAGRIPPAAVHRSMFSRGAAVRRPGSARRSDVAGGERSHQFSGEARFALAGAAYPGAVSRPHSGVQGFRRALHGAADGLFRARRNAPADRAGGDFWRYRQRGGARISAACRAFAW